MEFTKDIFFNDVIQEGKEITITYRGELFKNNSDKLTIVFGYGQNWDYTTEQEMEKTENGFVARIQIRSNFDTFNFCFRNSFFAWDNNSTFNYISPILPAPKKTENKKEDLSENIVLQILDALLDENVNNIPEPQNSASAITLESDSKQQILDDILSETLTKDAVKETCVPQDFDMDELVENILNPVINFTEKEPENDAPVEYILKDISEYNSPLLKKVETNQKTEVQRNLDLLANELVDLNTDLTNYANGTNLIPETDSEENEPSLLDIINFMEAPTTNEPSNENYFNFDEEELSKPVAEGNYLVSPRQLGRFYMFKKKIKLAFYKLFTAVPRILNETTENNKNQ